LSSWRALPDHGSLLGAAIASGPYCGFRFSGEVMQQQAKPTIGLKNRRKRAGWNTDYLAAVIQQAA